jgi:threonine aldolase
MASRWPGSVDPKTIRTNIVCADTTRLPNDFVRRLAQLGVLCATIDPRTVRLVTHKDVTDDDIEQTIKAFDALGNG